MPGSSISPPSSAERRPLRDRLLPSWVVSFFSRGRAASSAPIASSAIASSVLAPGDDADPPDGPLSHSHSSSFTAAASPSGSPSQSPAEPPSLRHRLSLSSRMSRLSRAFGSSGRGSPPASVSSPYPDYASDALQVPPSPSADGTNGTGPESLTGVLSPPRAVEASETTASAAGLSSSNVSTASIDVPAAASDDSMTEMWTEAVTDWQRKTGLDLTVPDDIPLRSKAAVMNYMAKMEKEESECEKGEWETLRERVDPLARILEKLCNPIGDTISAAFPPSNIIFAAVGLILSAYIRTREDFAQIGDAFNEMRFHLQVIETVVGSHPCDVLRTACVLLLTKVLSVLGVIAEMRREGYLRQWLSRISSQTRPLSEALQNLRLLATNQQQAMAAGTLNKVTQLMESIANDKVSQEWIRGCLVDVLRATRELHDLGSSTQAEVIAHRTALRRMELVLYNHSDKLRKIEMFAECEQIKEWLQYVDPSYRLRKLLDDRAEGTGSWFLDGDEFAALKEGKTKAVLLSGKAGSGKSTIIAAAVEALRAYHACNPHPLVLAHVFDSTNASSSQRDLHALLSTLLCQLALNNTHCASIISEAHKKIVANGLPTKARMEELFMETLRATSLHAIVVVDALDESSDEDGIICFIRRLQAISAISVLASRRPVMDSAQVFGAVVSMDNQGENHDIGLLLDIAMSQGGDLAKVQFDRNGVRERLLARAEGNFRWVALVIQELKGVAGIPTKVLHRLESLPLSLQALYQQCLNSIRDDDRDDVRRLLLWLVRSEMPLQLNDFADLMAFDYSHETPIYHASHRPLPEAVISMVGSMLITVDGRIVRLAHASVRDFLLGLPSQSPFFICKDTDYTLMARTVLAYLAAIDQMASSSPNPPLTYTWVYYVHKAGRKFFDNLLKEVTSVISNVAAHSIGTAVINRSLRTAARIGHRQLVAVLVDNSGVEIDCADTDGRTSLHIAAINGHLDVASLLLGRGAAVTARDKMRFTPLLMAARFSRDDVVCLLLDQGARVEECTERSWTALHCAACEGHLRTARLLLGKGASIAARTNEHATPLTLAACNGRENIVCLLLDEGADIEECGGNGETALHFASRHGRPDLVGLLLKRGASVVARNKHQHTPLIAAAQYGRENVIGLLLDNGAQIEEHIEQGYTSLHYAAHHGHLDTAHLLLERGAFVSARACQQATPLTIAANSGREAVVRLLLDKGAHIEECGETGETALHFASRDGLPDLVGLLLERGASVIARNKSQHTPLMAAAQYGRENVIGLLLDNGARTEDREELGWTSLHCSARNGHLGTTHLLLARGACVDARSDNQSTPLRLVAGCGQEDIARLLLDKGARVESCTETGWTSLHIAAQNGHIGTVRLLLERGASTVARTRQQQTPVMIAANHGREEIVRLLLEQGVDVGECDVDGCTPLHFAARRGHPGIAALLFARGASISAQNKQQVTPLMVAAINGREDVVYLLLDKGAHVDDRDEDGWTSLLYAADEGHLGISRLLLEQGASISARTDHNATPLIVAAYSGREETVRLLLDQGACVEDCGRHGWTSLHWAAKDGHIGIARLLLEYGASISARTEQQVTPLTVAANNGRESIVCLLLDKGAHINDCANDGRTSLHGAAWNGHLIIVSMLLERGADVNAMDVDHHTPLHDAAEKGHAEIAKLLVNRGAVIEARNIDGWTPLYLAVRFCQKSTTALLLSLGSDLRTRANDGTTLLDAVGRAPWLMEDAERDTRIRELLMRAGCTEETGRIPLINRVLPESARAASS